MTTMNRSVTVKILIGRWHTAKDEVVIKDLNEETLVRAIKRHIRDNYGGIANVLSKATQALVWDEDYGYHNLLAVYDIRGDKITML